MRRPARSRPFHRSSRRGRCGSGRGRIVSGITVARSSYSERHRADRPTGPTVEGRPTSRPTAIGPARRVAPPEGRRGEFGGRRLSRIGDHGDPDLFDGGSRQRSDHAVRTAPSATSGSSGPGLRPGPRRQAPPAVATTPVSSIGPSTRSISTNSAPAASACPTSAPTGKLVRTPRFTGCAGESSPGDHARREVDVGGVQARHLQHRHHRATDLVLLDQSAERPRAERSVACSTLIPRRCASSRKLRSIQGRAPGRARAS